MICPAVANPPSFSREDRRSSAVQRRTSCFCASAGGTRGVALRRRFVTAVHCLVPASERRVVRLIARLKPGITESAAETDLAGGIWFSRPGNEFRARERKFVPRIRFSRTGKKFHGRDSIFELGKRISRPASGLHSRETNFAAGIGFSRSGNEFRRRETGFALQ
jgi:hypothetical protein